MKIDVPDNVLFRMPKDQELQWAAMAIIQKWVNNYEIRMEKMDTSFGRARFVLHYELEISADDFNIFRRAGLELSQWPEKLKDHPDMVVDLRDERLLTFADTGKHVVQVCGTMCGEEAKPLPVIRKVHPGLGAKWGQLMDECSPLGGGEFITSEDLFRASDGEWMGVIGRASWQTYLAAAMYLPAIEVIPVGRNKKWLSKYQNLGYRVVVDGEYVSEQIEAAKKSIEELLINRCSQAQVVAGV